MRRWHGFILAFVLLGLGLALRYADPGPIQTLRLAVFDTYQTIKPRPYADAPVRIVDIDEASMSRYGQWPWSRARIAELVDRLGEAGAAAIVFSIVFAEPERDLAADLQERLRESTVSEALGDVLAALGDAGGDDALAASIARWPVTVGFAASTRSGPRPATPAGFSHAGDDPRLFVPTIPGAVTNLPALQTAAAGNGLITVFTDRDDSVHRLPLYVRMGDTLYPSLSAEALRVAQGAKNHILKASGASGTIAFGDQAGIAAVRIGGVTVPTDSRGRLWLYDTGPVGQRRIPAWTIFEPGPAAAEVAGRIVIIGVSAAGLGDRVPTPLSPAADGASLHAQALEQMINQDFLSRPLWAKGAEALYLVAMGLLVMVSFMPRRLGPALSTLFGAIAVVGAIALSWWAFDIHGYLFDPVYPILVGAFVYLANAVVNFVVSESERREVRSAFGQYVSPALVEELARNRKALALGGTRREMSILFSDIRDFTALAERLEPEELTQLLNRYLTGMSTAILDRRGTIDKYMGDAIMAFWNAPLPQDRHAEAACEAALAMIDSLADIDVDLPADSGDSNASHGLRIGIGINTGPCIVGNMGSEQRFDYTAMGDTVNLASRLEGQSKVYGVPIVVGFSTCEAAAGFAFLELDLIRVKGRHGAAQIYALIGGPAEAESAAFAALRDNQAAMLAAYRAQDWDRALGHIGKARTLPSPIDLSSLCDCFERRIEAYRREPPGADWDGVYVASAK